VLDEDVEMGDAVWLVLAFFMLSKVLLRPFMPAMVTLVGILKFSLVNDHGRTLLQCKIGHHATSERAGAADVDNLFRTASLYPVRN
jgi:hypothetical protein